MLRNCWIVCKISMIKLLMNAFSKWYHFRQNQTLTYSKNSIAMRTMLAYFQLMPIGHYAFYHSTYYLYRAISAGLLKRHPLSGTWLLRGCGLGTSTPIPCIAIYMCIYIKHHLDYMLVSGLGQPRFLTTHNNMHWIQIIDRDNHKRGSL